MKIDLNMLKPDWTLIEFDERDRSDMWEYLEEDREEFEYYILSYINKVRNLLGGGLER